MATATKRTPPLIGPARSLAAMMRTARGQSFLEALARSAQPAPTAPCLQPGCPEQCTWTDSPGRPALFCSRACQEMFKRDVARLRAEIAILENELEGDHDDADVHIIRSHLARRRWHLKRYQPLPPETPA